MAEIQVTKQFQREVKRRPKVEDFKNTAKLFFKNKFAFAGFVITVIYFLLALLDEVYPSYLGVSSYSSLLSFQVSYSSVLPLPPTFDKGWWYYMGTTQLGSYKFALFPSVLGALKFDMGYSLIIVLAGAAIGVILGTFSATYGKYLDEVLMRVTDVFFSLPYLIIALAFIFILGRYLIYVVYALIIVWWPIYARLARGQSLYVKSTKFVEAAYAAGSSRIRTVFSHILPNVLSPVFIQLSLDIGSIVQIFAALDYLGVSVSPYIDELGNIISLGQTYLSVGVWWPIVLPGIFLLIFTVSVNMMGDGLRDVLDPRLRR
ncbi:MAG TPA: ABC transporter permease [Thermoplasmataceae archaeon]|nr:ABC transporter permease [Thermoplasmatales archaeon AK]HLH85709.1 ABC transporter permease [Thermoplasmataceae archaeon]